VTRTPVQAAAAPPGGPSPAQHSGIKIFFHQDDPVMTEQEVEALNPDLIIYQ
jgi:hypothetical protein